MNMETFRNAVDAPGTDKDLIGVHISTMLSNRGSLDKDDYVAMLEIVSRRLKDMQNFKDELQSLLNRCKNVHDLDYNMKNNWNIDRYIRHGVPVNDMIIEKYKQFAIDEIRSCSFFKKIAFLFFGV